MHGDLMVERIQSRYEADPSNGETVGSEAHIDRIGEMGKGDSHPPDPLSRDGTCNRARYL